MAGTRRERSEAVNPAWGVPSRHEPRWPASLALLAVVGLYVTLPARFTFGPVWLLPVLEVVTLVPISFVAPHRHENEPPWQRAVSIFLIGLVCLANVSSLVLLVNTLLNGSRSAGTELIFAAIQIWLTNVLVFALWYWELDRGGPSARRRTDHREPDFLFPQMSSPGAAPAGWVPRFVDYLYVAFTNAAAFSPTDTLPLTAWAKLLMLIQSLASLLTVALVAARAVNILS